MTRGRMVQCGLGVDTSFLILRTIRASFSIRKYTLPTGKKRYTTEILILHSRDKVSSRELLRRMVFVFLDTNSAYTNQPRHLKNKTRAICRRPRFSAACLRIVMTPK